MYNIYIYTYLYLYVHVCTYTYTIIYAYNILLCVINIFSVGKNMLMHTHPLICKCVNISSAYKHVDIIYTCVNTFSVSKHVDVI